MRLLNAKSLEIKEFYTEVPQYAILSHRWGNEECSLQDMKEANVRLRKGFAKIEHTCTMALKNGLEWVWVDT